MTAEARTFPASSIVKSLPDGDRPIDCPPRARRDPEIGGAYLVWQVVREGQGWALALLGGLALFLYGFVATLQSDPHFGRILAAYGGVFVVGSLAWGAVFDGFRPDRFDLIGAAICLVGVVVIMYAPRGALGPWVSWPPLPGR